MIGLDLDGYFHKNILLTLWISYKISVHILYFVIFFELSTPIQNVEFHIHQRYIDTGSFEVIFFVQEKWLKWHTSYAHEKWLICFRMSWQTSPNPSKNVMWRDVISFISKVSNVDLSLPPPPPPLKNVSYRRRCPLGSWEQRFKTFCKFYDY